MKNIAVFVVNSGSSSLKVGLFQEGKRLLDGAADEIGRDGGKLVLKDGDGQVLVKESVNFARHGDALTEVLKRVRAMGLPTIGAVGHRVVNGGPRVVEHQRITPAVVKLLQEAMHFSPSHMPASVELIHRAEAEFSGVPQFICLDTAYHRTMPQEASRYPLPEDLAEEGLRRYGAHGLSYESAIDHLEHECGVPRRLVVAHLGNGCSVTAIHQGKSVDTSMGLTPTGGVVMPTRTGDLDPGVLLYLMRVKGMAVGDLEKLLTQRAGLVGLCGESDMRRVEASAEAGEASAKLALLIFDRAIAKTIAGYASVLGGLDMLVFTGGIGENSKRTRKEVLERLKFMGEFTVKIVPSEEEAQIARHCWRLLREAQLSGPSTGEKKDASVAQPALQNA